MKPREEDANEAMAPGCEGFSNSSLYLYGVQSNLSGVVNWDSHSFDEGFASLDF